MTSALAGERQGSNMLRHAAVVVSTSRRDAAAFSGVALILIWKADAYDTAAAANATVNNAGRSILRLYRTLPLIAA